MRLKVDAMEGHVQELEIQLARLEMLLEVSRKLNATLDLDTLLHSLLEVAGRLTDARAAAVLLLDEKMDPSQCLVISRKAQEGAERSVLLLEGSLGGWIVRTGEPLVIDNLAESPQSFSEFNQVAPPGTRAVLGVPLKTQGETLGALEVFDKHYGAGFNGDDIHLLHLLAAQAAVAIKNARLFQQNDQLAQLLQVLDPPAAAILDISRMVLSDLGAKAPDFQPELRRINDKAAHLRQVVRYFSDLIQLETGRGNPQRQPVDLQALVVEAITGFLEMARDREVALLWNPQPSPQVLADSRRLRQVIDILLDNAIRYNLPRGRVDISLLVTRVRVQLAIRDTGRGIAPADLDLIFEKFYRVPNGARENISGGLGLPLAKKIIQAHHGDIWVESEAGRGSTFTFSLPVANAR